MGQRVVRIRRKLPALRGAKNGDRVKGPRKRSAEARVATRVGTEGVDQRVVHRTSGRRAGRASALGPRVGAAEGVGRPDSWREGDRASASASRPRGVKPTAFPAQRRGFLLHKTVAVQYSFTAG